MPSKALQNFKVEPDIVLGNNFGKSCSTNLLNYFKNNFIKHGLVVEINNPYAGGYITRKYGNTSMNVHTIQIEVNRKLYMDEKHLVILKDIEKIQKIFFDILNNFNFKLTSI
jgi:N-formylglutamate amidohydrolase